MISKMGCSGFLARHWPLFLCRTFVDRGGGVKLDAGVDGGYTDSRRGLESCTESAYDIYMARIFRSCCK